MVPGSRTESMRWYHSMTVNEFSFGTSWAFCARVNYVIIHSSFRELIIQVVGHACFASISRSSLITPALSPESVIKGPPIDVSNCSPNGQGWKMRAYK